MSENPEWTTVARCIECGAETDASAVPNYCPVCEEWGVMEAVENDD